MVSRSYYYDVNRLALEYFSQPPEMRRRSERDRLLEEAQPIVKKVAYRVHMRLPSFSADYDDIVSYGNFGLIDAVDGGRFDVTRGLRFITFAQPRIKGAIMDGLRSQDPMKRLWRTCAKIIASIHRPRLIEDSHADLPSYEEFMAVARTHKDALLHTVSRDTYERARIVYQEGYSIVSFTDLRARTQGNKDGEDKAVDFEDRGSDLERGLMLSDEVQRLWGALMPREQRVVELYYFEDLTMKEIGRMLKLTESRVCQLHAHIVKKLRRLFPALA